MAHVRFVNTESDMLGLEYLSAVLKQASHTTDIVFDFRLIFNNRSKNTSSRLRELFVRHLLRNKPDVLAFSATSINIQWAFGVAEAVKKKSNIPIVFGGIQSTLIPEAVIRKEFIDFVVVGEGEGACVELVDGLSRGEVDPGCKNLWFKKNGEIVRNPPRALIDPLDTLPFPDKTINPIFLWHSDRYSTMTGRGCVGTCTYCCTPTVRQTYYRDQKWMRRRSPQNVIEELVLAKQRFQIKKVFFEDDLFSSDRTWLTRFSSLYKKNVNLPCLLCVHPDFVDEETASCLKAMGCLEVEIGAQTFNTEIREKVLKRHHSNEQVRKSLSLLKAAGISSSVSNIVCLPGEQIGDVQEMVSFYNEVRPGKIDVFYLKCYPKSEIINFMDWPEGTVEKLNGGAQYESTHQPDPQQRTQSLREINQLLLVLVLSYFLPRKVVRFILKKKWYLYFPSLKSCFRINEVFFYLSCLLTKRRKQVFLSLRGNKQAEMFYDIKLRLALWFGSQG